ncbi:MAG TPA: DUF4269 domain-containing protein [Polyangiaceae bacterium]|nr:DUF4269 domain-containing protein [Polyangiaceae bacterium]
MQQFLRLSSALAPFTPTLVGTYPLGLQTSTSDFDLICSCSDLGSFERSLSAELLALGLSHTPPRRVRLAVEASVTNLHCDGLAVEVFCQTIPVSEQHGFRHMIIEGRLLCLGGERLRARVLALRADGLKTEPAFASALGLSGDPYAALLQLETQSQQVLMALLSGCGLL